MGKVVIADLTLIDGTSRPPQEGVTVIVRGSRVSSVMPASAHQTVPEGATVVDGHGKFLIPGLWDAHVHVSSVGREAMTLLLANGVTSVRDMGGVLSEIRSIQEAISKGKLVGPRIRTAGSGLDDAGWVQKATRDAEKVGDKEGVRDLQARIAVTTETEARAAVEALNAERVDFLKVRTLPSREIFAATLETAQLLRMPSAAHAPEWNVFDTLELGPTSLEHAETVHDALRTTPDRGIADLGPAFVTNRVLFTPTLLAQDRAQSLDSRRAKALIDDRTGKVDERNAYVGESLRTQWKLGFERKRQETPRDDAPTLQQECALVREMNVAGTTLLAGTDLGVPFVLPGFGLHDELDLLVRSAGLTSMQALLCATRNPPLFFSLQEELGTLEPGKVADMVLLDANPLSDIRNISRINAVVLGGKPYDRSALDGLLGQVRRSAGKPRNSSKI
jgi:imidazolonepropionase-like amidohydrolase